MSVLEFAFTVMYFNVLTFGNGPVLIPLLQTRFVEEEGILSLNELLYAFAIARVTPGQANVYVASVGYFIHGIPGALLSMLAIQIPGYLILPLVRVHERYRNVAAVRRFTRSLTATSVGLIFAATLSIGRNTIDSASAAIVFALAFAMIYLLKWNAILSLALATLAGAILYILG